jgi:GNAT superfamily N-acetyltransferase
MVADDNDSIMPIKGPCVSLNTLGRDDANDMLALAEHANPGPFGARTHLLGRFVGYRQHGRLLAMGGVRFRFPGLVELSAICVHRDARGRGLGAAVTWSRQPFSSSRARSWSTVACTPTSAGSRETERAPEEDR